MGRVAGIPRMLILAGCLLVLACKSKDPAPSEPPSAPPASLPAASLQVLQSELLRLDMTRAGGETVTLEKADGKWKLVAPRPYPANPPAVESILAVMAEIEIQRPVADQGEAKHRVGADSGILVQAWTSEGARPAFRIGASQGEETFVRREDEEAVYAVRGRCRRFFDLSFEQLRDPTITKVDVTTIESVTYSNPQGELKLVADSDKPGRFTVAEAGSKKIDHERASKNVAVLAALLAKGYVDPPVDEAATGLFRPDTPQILIAVQAKEQPLKVFVGTPARRGRLHLRTSASDQVFLVSGHLGSTLLAQRKHFEGSDTRVAQEEQQAQDQSAPTTTPRGSSEHKHGTPLPTQVPDELLSELRQLSRHPAD